MPFVPHEERLFANGLLKKKRKNEQYEMSNAKKSKPGTKFGIGRGPHFPDTPDLCSGALSRAVSIRRSAPQLVQFLHKNHFRLSNHAGFL